MCSLVPRSFPEEENRPGLHCWRMRVISILKPLESVHVCTFTATFACNRIAAYYDMIRMDQVNIYGPGSVVACPVRERLLLKVAF